MEEPVESARRTDQGRACANCGAAGVGAHCSACGEPHDDGQSVYFELVDSFLKLTEIKNYVRLYASILRSPTRETIRVFEQGLAAEGKRFLEYSAAVYLLAIAVTGIPVFGDNEVVKAALQGLWLVVLFSVTYGLYYWTMHRKAGAQRSRGDYLFFVCLTLGFTLPAQVPGLVLGFWGQLLGTLLIVPYFIYLFRTWRWFWATSGARAFGMLLACSLVGSVIGALVLLPLWMVVGMPPG